MKKFLTFLLCLGISLASEAHETRQVPEISCTGREGWFPLVSDTDAAVIYTDIEDFAVAGISAGMLADDIGRVTGIRTEARAVSNHKDIPEGAAVIAGTLGHSALTDWIVRKNRIDTDGIEGKWESFMILTTEHPRYGTPLLVILGSDRRGTAFGLTTLCEAIGVSPWYWWADVPPHKNKEIFVEPGTFSQGEPSVQYRGIFINDERFGGWAKWAEQTFDKESGKVGPKTYEKVFELLLRLKANYL